MNAATVYKFESGLGGLRNVAHGGQPCLNRRISAVARIMATKSTPPEEALRLGVDVLEVAEWVNRAYSVLAIVVRDHSSLYA
jgi:hypothetical protein